MDEVGKREKRRDGRKKTELEEQELENKGKQKTDAPFVVVAVALRNRDAL